MQPKPRNARSHQTGWHGTTTWQREGPASVSLSPKNLLAGNRASMGLWNLRLVQGAEGLPLLNVLRCSQTHCQTCMSSATVRPTALEDERITVDRPTAISDSHRGEARWATFSLTAAAGGTGVRVF